MNLFKTSMVIIFTLVTISANAQSAKSPVKQVYISNIPKPTAPAVLEISEIKFVDAADNQNNILNANEEITIQFDVTNTGRGDAYHLMLNIETIKKVSGMYFEQEMLLGDLKSKSTKTVRFPISSTMALKSGDVSLSLIIAEGNGFDTDAFKVEFPALAFQSPMLALADHLFISEAGGKVTLGQTIYLNFVLQNQGQGDVTDINVRFDYPENIFPVNETLFHIDALSANESRNLVFEFFSNKKYPHHDIPIKVSVTENYGNYGLSETLTVFLEQSLSRTNDTKFDGQFGLTVAIDNISLRSDVDKDIPLNSNQSEMKFALIIGNEDYASNQPGLSNEVNVAFANNDALVFKSYCERTLGVPEENIIFLMNGTYGRMSQSIAKMNKLIETTNGQAEVLVYYAGHGLPDEKTKEPYLIPVDVSGTDLSSAIKLTDLYAQLTEFPSRQVTVFIDACFTGGGRNNGLVAARGVRVKPKSSPLKGNIVVFTASSAEESSLPWASKQHGMFTYFLLKKLQETKGKVTYGELSEYLSQKVSLESVRTNSKSQHPSVLVAPEKKADWKGTKF